MDGPDDYEVCEGNPISLEQLILQKPEWAAARIRAGQREGVTKRFKYLADQLAERDKRIAELEKDVTDMDEAHSLHSHRIDALEAMLERLAEYCEGRDYCMADEVRTLLKAGAE